MKASFEKVPANSETETLERLRIYREYVESHLDTLVPSDTTEPLTVHQAIRWSLFAGGKRLRPSLVLATGEAFGCSIKMLLTVACSFEMIHTYSLIHDDLPSMDNDDLRRGRETCHVRFGEATAILAGDALQALAFQAISENNELSPGIRLRTISEVARAAGTPAGMVAGQAFDLASDAREVSPNELEKIHRYKTGALIVASTRVGAIIAGAEEEELASVTDYGEHLGLLFQITDDILDVTATSEELGKTPGKDARSSKATFPALYGLKEARNRARVIYNGACAALDQINKPTDLLREIAKLTLERRA